MVDDHVWGCDFLRLSALPPHEVIESLLAALEHHLLRLVQLLRQLRQILVVRILWTVHYRAKPMLGKTEKQIYTFSVIHFLSIFDKVIPL